MTKLKNFTVYAVINVFVFLFIYPANINAQGFGTTSLINDIITVTSNSGEKPQSKLWKYNGYWWAVMPVEADPPDDAGTYLWRLDDVTNTWEKIIKLSSSTNVQADAKAVGGVTHILLFKGAGIDAELVSIQFVAGTPPTYEPWTSRTTLAAITLDGGVETATIDIAGNGRMWLASDGVTDINIRWSDSPYDNWTHSKINLTPTVTVDIDDICAVTAFNDNGNKIGVMWSDQDNNKFMFAYHADGTSVTAWTTETAAATPNGFPSGGIADDHINFAVAGNGTIYAVVKTSYDTDTYPMVALLVRSPSGGGWQGLISVRNRAGTNREPTRPIALLDETNSIITIVYTQDVHGDDIMYKSASISTFDFSPDLDGKFLIDNDTSPDWDNVTSTKQNINSDVVILASSGSTSNPFTVQTWRGVIASTSPLPVELAFFAGTLNGNNVELRWRTETELNNYGFYIERAIENSDWLAIGFVEGHGNSNSPKQYNYSDNDINLSGEYYYRLKQIDNDGTFEYSDVVTVTVGVPVLYSISQNYPNPFNPETRIDYTLPEQQNVSLRVYNMLGELVRELVNEVKPAGTYTVTFDGSDLPSGIYVYRIQTEGFSENKKMTLLK